MVREISRLLRSVAILALFFGSQSAFIPAQVHSSDAPSEEAWTLARQTLIDKCIDCHGPDSQESKLRLDSREGIAKGGDFGPILEERWEDSELHKRIGSSNENYRMPPDAPLSEDEIRAIKQWIADGYPWEREKPEQATEDEAGENHWAWQLLTSPKIPMLSSDQDSSRAEAPRNPIDLFIREKLQKAGLQPSPPADRRTLIRRLSIDLLGLPPTYEQIQAFENSTSPTAYEELVDSFLSSPRYGERWARHWLDVVHYGDTHGYDKDKPRENAWPYRDYVIRSLNQDKSYSRFIQEQVAGDVMFPDDADSVIATGFLSAGPWDLIGHLEVPETKTDGKIARHLDRDDMVANTIGTFCSVTIHCAQCHNHKFDPIPQSEYYSLQAVFAAIDRNDRPYSQDPEVMSQISKTEREYYKSLAERDGKRSAIEAVAKDKFSQWETLEKAYRDSRRENGAVANKVHGGYHSEIAADASVHKWVQVDLGAPTSIRSIKLHPCYDDFASIGAGFGFPVSYRVEVSNDPEFLAGVQTWFEQSGETPLRKSVEPVEHLLDPNRVEQTTATQGWRYVRVHATQLALRDKDYIFALAECEVLDQDNRNVAFGKPVTSLDSIEAPDRWRKSNLVDGLSSFNAGKNLDESRRVALEEVIATVGKANWEEYQQVEAETTRLKTIWDSFAKQPQVYAASTKVRRGVPRPIHLLSRGNVNSPREEVAPAALGLLKTLSSQFDLNDIGDEGERRVALANWLAAPENSLTWRSIVNRLWQYHFGTGIVATSNDFGLMGSVPTHPELLDWLAVELKENDGSLKAIHRLIVTSATYRQTSQALSEHLEKDSNNQLLARYSRTRLDAESIRDCILMSSGNLDLRMGGPGWRDFQMVRPEHSPHYRYDLADANDRSTWRRAVYRFIARSQTQPFLTSLDCADPSMRVEKRNSSITSLQSLAMLNNDAVLVQCRELAARIRLKTSEAKSQIVASFIAILGREPSQEEAQVLLELHQQAGLENVCRVLFNSNELVFVD